MQARHEEKYDVLRGLASIAVFLAHVLAAFFYRLIGSDSLVAQASGTVARHAVLVFFLLSGFLVTLSVISNIQRNGRLDVRAYLAARIARIYPPLIGAIAIVLVVFLLIHGLGLPGAVRYGVPGDTFAVRDRFSFQFADVVRTLLMENGMLQADGPLWSLYIEFHLYIVAMFLALAVTLHSTVQRVLSAAIGLMLVGWWIRQDTQFVFYMAVWGLGSGISIWRARLATGRTRRVLAGLAWAIGFAWMALATFAPQTLVVDKPGLLVSFLLQFAACVAYAYFIFLAHWGKNAARWQLRLGEFSYSLYVIHFPLLLLALSLAQDWMGRSMARTAWVAGISVLAVMGISVLFADFFENQRRFKPAIRSALDAIFRTCKRSVITP